MTVLDKSVGQARDLLLQKELGSYLERQKSSVRKSEKWGFSHWP